MSKQPISMKRAFIFTLLLLPLSTIRGKVPASKRILHYSPKEGLSFGVVNCITQDNRGFIWIGTADGLNRFDGTSFKTFKYEPGNKYSLPGNYVQSVFKDREGNLWVSSRKGLNLFDPKTERFINYRFNPRSTSEGNDVSSISASNDGNLWVTSSGSGIFYFDKKNRRFTNYNTSKLKGLPANSILTSYQDSQGWLWVGTINKGVVAFRINHGKIGEKVKIPLELAADSRINNIFEDHLHNVWIATSKGLLLFKRKESRVEVLHANDHQMRSDFFLSLAEDSRGALLIGLQDGGMYRFDLKQLSSTAPRKYRFEQIRGEDGYNVTYRSVQTIFTDSDQNIWAGTYGSGLYMISKTEEKFGKLQLRQKDQFGESVVRFYGLCMDNEGFLWLGTDGNGIYKVRTNGLIVKHYASGEKKGSLTDNAILYGYKDKENNLWFGTYKKGLFLYDRKSDTFSNFSYHQEDKYSLGNNDVRVIYQDRLKNIWVGTAGGGLNLLNRATKRFVRYLPSNSSLSSGDIRALAEDKHGNLWIGTYGGGLNYFDRHSNKFYRFFQNPQQKNFLSNNVVFALYLDKHERLWIGTEGDGLLMYNTIKKTVRIFNEKNGLANNSVYSIKADKSGNIWVGTNRGLSKINPHDGKTFNYDEGDGLQGGQFNENSALYCSNGGFMCFGGTEGLNIFYPDNVRQSSYHPKILITGLELFGKPTRGESEGLRDGVQKSATGEITEVVLPANQSVFSIQYAALNYAYPTGNQYAYKLEGMDKDWNYVQNQKSVTYRYLEPGDYVFKVKVANQDGVWFDNYASLRVTVLPPWYRTWWAYVIYAGFIGVSVRYYLLYKANQARLKYELKIAYIEAEKEKELNEKKLTFFTNISHEFRDPLTMIINPVKQLLYGGEKNADFGSLNIVYKNARRLLSLVDQLLYFRKTDNESGNLKVVKLDLVHLAREVYLCFNHQARMRNIELTYECQEEHIEVYGDREKLEIVIFNLLSNAIKFTPDGGTVSFSIVHSAADIVIEIKDSGCGIPPEVGNRLFDRFYQVDRPGGSTYKGFGIGLYLVKSLVENHKGEISYESEPGRGSTFKVKLLKGSDHFDKKLIYEDVAESSVFLEELMGGQPGPDPRPAENITPMKQLELVSADLKSMLIIDDNEQVRQYIKNLFDKSFDFFEAGNGDAGLEMVYKYMPDIIISDVVMAGLSGLELCMRIKGDLAVSHIPVILLTASSSPEIKLKGIESGADDYISKPFDKDLLIARVTNLLKGKDNLQKYFFNEITLKPHNLKVSPEHKKFLEKCIAVVEKNMTDEDFNLKVLASEIGMSQSSLNAKIKAVSGQTPNSFIRFIRLRKAAEIFLSTDSTIYEAAYAVGLKDLKWFREQFSRLFGMNPSEYIKRYRKTFHQQYTVSKELNTHKD